MTSMILPVLWAGIIAFCILMYVTLDGFTLGTAILMPSMTEPEREQALSMILPNWDGNQTWLVLGGASLYGAFPLAFGTILPLLYLPIVIMVIALLFRGVAFEFRLKSKTGKRKWDWCFTIGSLIATFVQGMVLGAFIQGFHYSSTGLLPTADWLSLYTVFTGFALVFGYALLGAARLILKTEGTLSVKMRRYATNLAWINLFLAFAVSLWTPFIDPAIFERWFRHSRLWLIFVMPLITFLAWIYLMVSLKKGYEKAPYWMGIIIFCCCYLGFAIGIWPYIVPHEITIWQAASPDGSLLFMLVGAVIMIPLLLVYTGYSYKIFGGKVRDNLHY